MRGHLAAQSRWRGSAQARSWSYGPRTASPVASGAQDDLVSRVCEFPYLNPQTGPFYVEGAEPGDTLAVHFISMKPARDWAASTTVPLFGALTSTHLTATLQDALPEVVWIWELDRAARSCAGSPRATAN